MSWTRGPFVALAVCALLGGAAGCGADDAHGRQGGATASPVGKLLDDTDERGRHYREVAEKGAPEVSVEVQPDSDDSWDVLLTVHHFRFSPSGARAVPVAGRGVALLSLDGRTLARLRTRDHHLPGRLVPRGTHHVTVRLYADDGTVWAVDGRPVQSTADITASGAGPTAPGSTPSAAGSGTEGAGAGGTPTAGGSGRRPRAPATPRPG
ncbi:nuclear transport factor 2 family protein [Streptomyces avermitilis]|uniref:nuclear transport factor 2 family protein n=1 Tax=Streptomyces avermitilis TaxID=33903 RepID=UPI0033B4025B